MWLAGAAAGIEGVALGDLSDLEPPAEEAAAPPRPTDPAWVTSSGLVLSHRALAHAMAPGARDATWLCAAPWPSAAAVTELLAPLCSGGVAVLAATLPDTIPEEITHLRLTPLVAERVLPAGVTAIVSGDPLVRKANVTGSDRVVTAVEVDGLPGWVAFDGRPAPGVRVVDTELRLVPAGVVGELCLDGTHRTGLLARFTDDGTLEQVGPAEERTHRGEQPVELYRTREQLDAQPSVLDSVVVLRAARDRERLVGYVRTLPGVPFTADGVRRALAEQRLSRPLIPEVLVQVDTWPMDDRGTLDPDRLPDPPDTTGEPGERPWDATFDKLLRQTFAAQADKGELTPDAPLADAGLDSFGTVGLLVAIEQAYGITIPDDFHLLDMFRTARTLWETVAALRDAR